MQRFILLLLAIPVALFSQIQLSPTQLFADKVTIREYKHVGDDYSGKWRNGRYEPGHTARYEWVEEHYEPSAALALACAENSEGVALYSIAVLTNIGRWSMHMAEQTLLDCLHRKNGILFERLMSSCMPLLSHRKRYELAGLVEQHLAQLTSSRSFQSIVRALCGCTTVGAIATLLATQRRYNSNIPGIAGFTAVGAGLATIISWAVVNSHDTQIAAFGRIYHRLLI